MSNIEFAYILTKSPIFMTRIANISIEPNLAHLRTKWVDNHELNPSPQMRRWPCIYKANFLNNCISQEWQGRMIWDMKRKGSESIGCWANYVTLTFDHTHNLDLGYLKTNFEIATFHFLLLFLFYILPKFCLLLFLFKWICSEIDFIYWTLCTVIFQRRSLDSFLSS